MLISAWLTAVRNRLNTNRSVKRRTSKPQPTVNGEHLESRALLTTTLQAVRPNVGEFLTPGEVRSIAPQELTLQFSLGSTITPSSVTPQSIRVIRSGQDGNFTSGNEVPVSIGYVGVGANPNEVVLRFGETLIDENYRIIVTGTGTNRVTATRPGTSGPVADPVTSSTFDFELDLGAKILAVDPQPVIRQNDGTLLQERNKIVIYFNEDDLNQASAENVNFYQLIYTNETVTSLDDTIHTPTSAAYDNVANTVTLTFASDIASLSGSGSYRLRVGNSETIPQAPTSVVPGADPGSSFATATSLVTPSTTTNTSQVISSSIAAQFLALQFPGAGDEPGHREVEIEDHLEGGADSGASGIPYIDYNFKDIYGTDPSGNALHNLITEAQKDRAREIFQFYSRVAGIDFRETASGGLTIVTGDLRALSPTIPTGPGGVAGLAGGGMAIMDMAETWTNLPGGSWFGVAIHEIGHLLGLGHTYDLPDPTTMGSGSSGSTGTNVEPVYPGQHDVVHMQHMYRPDSIDIDLYRFQVDVTSQVTAEVMAERLAASSRLDTVLRLYRETNGVRELIAQNDNYFSKDSFLDLTLEPGVYFIGVSSTGNDKYDPTIANTGFGGTSQGNYDLRLNFRPNIASTTSTIIDTTNKLFDGDSDGLQGGVYNFWFRTATASNTLFVDKATVAALTNPLTASSTQVFVQRTSPYAVNDVIRIDNEQMRITAINPATRALTVVRAVNSTTATTHSVGASVRKTSATGQIGAPFGYLTDAVSAAVAGQVVRVVGNGGTDGDISTTADNYAYEIGQNTAGQNLSDGGSLEVPKGVTVQVSAGSILKLRRGWIGTGSSTTSVDRSNSAFQVLGTPSRNVILTSWMDETTGGDTTATPTTPDEGDWGGIIYRNEIDRAQNRYNPENEGIFLNYVAFADIRWGGGTVITDTGSQIVNPIHMERSQPTVVNNTIRFSNDSAMSADPDSFEELTFHSPRFQTGKPAFTVDYRRVGPEIYGNTLLSNGNNALFVRIDTEAGGATQKMTVPGRFNDTDIVHLVAQNLELQGNPGGAYQDSVAPSVVLVTLNSVVGGTLAAGTYNYRIVFTDENGFESPASTTTGNFTLGASGSIRLGQLPPATGVYTGRRIYRSDSSGGGVYTLVGDVDKSSTTFTDNGTTLTRTLSAVASRDRARLSARLAVDPGIVVKLQGSRIELGMGAQIIAEGAPGRQVIFTSRLDDRYGAGGTFDTNNDDTATSESTPSAGNWGGIYVGQLGSASIDRALITFAGGSVPTGGGFASFNAIEVHQADARIRNTTFESNASGSSGGSRSGLLTNGAGTIFVRGSQPVILDNTFTGNSGAVININVGSLGKDFVVDTGRSTGLADRQLSYGDNQGPLIRDNTLERNGMNGMLVRGETLTTQSIWDDTDIVHILMDEVYVPNLHTFGGIRLESSATESLVVKLSGPTAGFTAGGSPLDITDRIGGMLHIVGQPGQPVILTSLSDDTVGAGFNLAGQLQKDTDNNGSTTGIVGGWRGINVERYGHDRNVAVYVENEIADRFSADTNATTPENVGSLAEKPQWADENLRLGVDLQGFIDNPGDIDVYSFSGVAGSQVWVDIDRSSYNLDSVVELLDSAGNILAQSDNYYDEKIGTWQVVASSGAGVQAYGQDYSQYLSDDHFSTNAKDAGFRVILPGTTGVRSTYYVRVRSSNIDVGGVRTDLQDNAKVGNGLTSGVYQLQLRLQEEDEFAGTTIQFADIRFAVTGVNIVGQPVHSPLAGESEETESNNATTTGGALGNLMDTDRAALAVRGTIGTDTDVDFYQFEVNYTHYQQIGGVSLVGAHVPVVFDLDYADGLARADLTLAVYDSTGALVLIGRDSNVTDDQAGPLEGNDLDDLTRGSVGTFDPYVGTVELPGGVYYLAVFNNTRLPAVMDQFSSSISNNALLRVEPVNSVRRIAEERFSADNADTFTSATAPITNLFDVTSGRLVNGTERGIIDSKHVVPYHLGDVVLFVSTDGGSGTNNTTVRTINPFTGQTVTTLGQFGPSVGDMAMRPDGQLYTFTNGPAGAGASNAANTGNYLRINTGSAAITNLGDDGITVNNDNLDANLAPTPADNNVTVANAVTTFTAMAFTGTGDDNLYAVGARNGATGPANSVQVAAYTTNVLYRFNISSGAVSGNGGDRINDARAYSGAGTTQVEMGQINVPGTVTGLASVAGQLYAVTSGGSLYRVNASNGNATFVTTFAATSFTSLSAGPDEVENGKYANVLFGMTTTGRLMAFNTNGVAQPVFYDGQSSLNTGITTSNGLAFSTLDRNLWQTTSVRGANAGHGVETRFDDSILASREDGGLSLYFGNQRAAADAGNANNLSTTEINNIDFPGGAHGSVVSNTFSLKGYRNADKPMLYFNYFLQTENTDDAALNQAMRDSFRVFVGNDAGTWTLASTNNSYRGPGLADDEFDLGSQVRETFDRNEWRQARVDLSRFAGQENLRLRFDFSTAGSMNLGNALTTGTELYAIDGYRIQDGEIVTIGGVNFEFDMGSSILFPSGETAIGQSFTVGGQTFTFATAAGGPNTIVVTAGDSAGTVATKAALAVNGVIPGAAVASGLAPSRLAFPGRTATSATLTVDGAAGVSGANRAMVITPTMTANQVATVVRQALANEWSAGDITNIKGHEAMIRVIGRAVTAAGPLGRAASLPGDSFGSFTGSNPSTTGMNNAVEGVYVDDIIIGFAERGEMVINANGAQASNFIDNPDALVTAITQGPYDVEIRRATDYAETGDTSPTNGLYKDISTNDREAELVSFSVPSVDVIPNRSVITISDGVNTVNFQFLDSNGTYSPTAGYFPIPFNPAAGTANDHAAETDYALAARLRDAINSTTVQNILKVKASLSDGRDSGTTSTSNQLHLTGSARVTVSADLTSLISITNFDAYGDQNHSRDQGQLIIRSSTISDSQNWGISSDAVPRGTTQSPSGSPPAPGSVRNLHTINTSRIDTGVVIMNNILAANGTGGILISGNTGTPAGQTPYARIVNNTIVGRNGAGVGVRVEESSSPTLLNNIIVDTATGIDADGSSIGAGLTIGSTLYRGNGVNSTAGLGAFPMLLSGSAPLFVDQANRNFYPAPLSQAIDSSLTSLGDRDSILAVKAPLDLDGRDDEGSPIIAPEFDVYGQLRGNDPNVETPSGQGSSVFIDRGAVDRVDFFQPQARLVGPEDQSLIDGDPDVDEVWIDQTQVLRQFRVRLIDEGIGIDNRTIDKSQFVLKRVATDGVTQITLVEGVDYTFVYNEITKEAIFNAATYFADQNTEVRYIILVDNDGTGSGDTVNGVRDLAGNYLLPNKADGTTRFDVVLTDGVNDPPVNTVPGNQTVAEDTNLIFSQATSNAMSIFDQDAHLGTNVMTITLSATNGTVTLGAIAPGLIFTAGDGTSDSLMTFTGHLTDLNAALEGLVFRPTQDHFGPASLTITTDDLGEFSGTPESDTDTVAIDVTPVNDAPTFAPVSNPPDVTEDQAEAGVTVVGFAPGISPGPANEMGQQVFADFTILSVTGSWTISSFFAAGPAIDTTNGTLTYRTASDVNGTATVRVVMRDEEGGQSAAQTFTITVTAVNDVPVYTLNPVIPITSLEDAGPQLVDLIDTFAPARATALDELNSQTVTWSISAPGTTSGNLSMDLFTIDALGNLRYTAHQDTAGVVSFTLTLTDDGSASAPNINATSPQTMDVTVIQVNDSPVPQTGSYVVDEGYSVLLNASASYDVDAFFGQTLTFEWDLNNDGVYETNSFASSTLTVDWATLSGPGIGITAPGVFPIRLKVTDSSGQANNSATVATTITTLIVDYGDAPDTYGTLQLSGGAAHTIANGLFMGPYVDKETTGVPTADATGDGADENGVVFPTTFESTPGQALPAYVDVTSSGSGKLDIWLDLNRNGVFDNATERLNSSASYAVTAGTNRIFFSIPAGTPIGDTMMRFRLSTGGNLLPTGRASDGEVEDYKVNIRTLSTAVTPTINRPVDFNTGDGIRPQTSDLTPTIVWSAHQENYYHDIVVRNSSGTVVFSRTNTTFTFADVTPALPAGNNYTATVTAYNKAGVAAAPATWSFDVVPIVVSAPTGNTFTLRPTIQWNHVLGTTKYTVNLESLTTGTTVLLTTFNTAGLTTPNELALTSDLPIGRYQVRVRATDAADQLGDWSPFVQFQIRTGPVVTAPVGSVSAVRPPITWSPVVGAATYEVELFNLTDNTLVSRVTGITSTTWTPTSNLTLADYQVRVRGFNLVSEDTEWSTPHVFRVSPLPVAIAPIGRLADATPTFNWNTIAAADQYELIVTQNFGTHSTVISQLALTSPFYAQPTNLPLGRYQYQIRAINQPAAGSSSGPAISSYSQTYDFTVTERPSIVNPPATTFLARPQVTWTVPDGAGASPVSDVWINKIENSVSRNILKVNGVSGTAWTVNTDLALGTYVVWVRTYSAVDPGTVSEWSIGKTFRVTTPPSLIGPTGRTNDATPTLTWQGVQGAQSYRVYVASLSVGGAPITDVSGVNALNYTVPSDLPIGRYRFWAQARSAFGDFSAWSIPVDFQVVAAPNVSGPSSSTFDATPTFTWNNMAGTINGQPAGARTYDFRLDQVLTNSVVASFRTATGLTSPTYTIPTDLPSGLYRAFVRAMNGDTQGDYSTALQFFVGGRPNVNSIPTSTNQTPRISWQSVDGASGYEIHIVNLLAPSTAVVRQSNIGSTSFTPTAALGKGNFRVWVRAFNAATGTASLWSNAVDFTITDVDTVPARTEGGEWILATLPSTVETTLTDSTVSMLPSRVYGSEAEFVEDTLTAEQESEVRPSEVLPVEQADAVLSGWDGATWWDQPAMATKEDVPAATVSSTPAPAIAPVKESGTARTVSAGILGAIFGLANSRRRRKDEESST